MSRVVKRRLEDGAAYSVVINYRTEPTYPRAASATVGAVAEREPLVEPPGTLAAFFTRLDANRREGTIHHVPHASQPALGSGRPG